MSLRTKLSLCFFNAGHVALGIGLYGVHLKEITANSIMNELSNSLGVALCNCFQAPVSVVFTLAGIVNDKNISHSDYLRVLFGKYIVSQIFR